MIPATDVGEHYDLGHADGRHLGRAEGIEEGRAQARGEIRAGILARAAAAERAAGTAPTVNLRETSAQVARWLRGLADEVKRGEL